MRPYYADSHVTIYHGDCREILPSIGQVDLVLTDPPYGIGVARHGLIGGHNKGRLKQYAPAIWDEGAVSWLLLEEAIEHGEHTILFGGNFYPVPPSSCWFVWDKDNSGNFADCELAWTNLKGAVRMFTWRWNGMLQENMRDKEYRYHPTQKPVPLMKWCIVQAEPCQTILDPFMGSGSTLVAGKALLKSCIGIEIEERYCEIAANRCRQMVMEF